MHRVVICLSLLLLAYLLCLSSVSDAEPISVGVSLPLSGPAATYGTDVRNAFEFLNDAVAKGRFNLIFADDKCDPKEAVAVAKDFTEVKKVKFVSGIACSGAALAAAPIYDRAKTLTVIALAGSAKLSDAGPFVFRTRPSDKTASAVLNHAIIPTHSNIGVLAEQTEYALGMLEGFRAAGVPSAVSLLVEEFAPQSTDFRSSLEKLRGRDVKALLLLPQSEQSAIAIVRQLAAMDWHPALYSNWALDSESFLAAAGSAADGAIIATLPAPDDVLSEEKSMLYAKFVSRYGKMQSVKAAFECSYNAMIALLQASEQQQDPERALTNTELNGYRDTFRFDEFGDITGYSFQLRVLRNGQIAALTR